MRRVYLLFLLSMLLTVTLFPVALHAQGTYVSSAEAAAIIDVTSGRILYNKRGDSEMRIASLTKVMTAIVAIEQGNLPEMVTTSKNAAGKEGSSIYLRVGEEMSLHHLLYGLMLRSGNDAAVAIAEHIGGSVEGFAYLMNEKAMTLGMKNSQFMNPSGLDEAGHYSSANDMAKLTAYALRNPFFQEIVKTKLKKAPNLVDSWDYVWANKNKMLSLYEGADGVKTGYTKLARRCLISSATRNGQQIAVVTLSNSNDWADHARALDYGFRQFPLTQLVSRGEEVEGTQLVAGVSVSYPLTERERNLVTRKVLPGDPQSIAYRMGELGRMQIMVGDRMITSLPLYDASNPRLRQPHSLHSFSFKASESYESTMELYVLKLRSVARALFTLR